MDEETVPHTGRTGQHAHAWYVYDSLITLITLYIYV